MTFDLGQRSYIPVLIARKEGEPGKEARAVVHATLTHTYISNVTCKVIHELLYCIFLSDN